MLLEHHSPILFPDNRSSKSELYTLMFGSQKIPVYCHMGNFGCGDGGWTLAMKIDGTKVSFVLVNAITRLCLHGNFFVLFSISENFPLQFSFLERQKYIQPCRRRDRI